MSAMIDSPARHVNRHRDHAHDTPTAAEPQSYAEPQWAVAEVWTAEEAWDDRHWDSRSWDSRDRDEAADPEPVPTGASAPAVGPGPAAQPGDGLAVPPRRTVAPFPPILAGRGRHRLPAAVRRRPGPIAAGLMVAATTLAAGSLRFSAPPPLRTSADTGHHCAPLLPGEPCG